MGFAAVLFSLVPAVAAFKYTFNYALSDAVQSVMQLTEGPMFTLSNTPFGKDVPYVSASFFMPPVVNEAQTANFYLATVDLTTRNLLGFTEVIGGGSATAVQTSYCCTPELYTRGVCGTGVFVGNIIVAPETLPPTARPQIVKFAVPLGEGSRGTASFTVPESSPQYLLAVVCDSLGGRLPAGPPVEVTAEFRNPYGFLPGTLAGLLPWYGVLLAAYLVLLCLFVGAMVRNREHLLPLQYLVLGVIGLGTLEMILSLATYDSKNVTGIPTPCNVCPVTADYMSSVVANVFKRSASRVLLLAVAMGFGVVFPTLPQRTSLGLLGLGVAYTIAGILDEVERETTYDATPSAWALPVVLLDLVFLALINIYHERTTKGLVASKQDEKLRMYRSLVRVVFFNVAAHVVITIIVIGIRSGDISLDWRALFFLAHFWDLLYFLGLCACAWIWAPSETAYRYAWYAQPASNDEGAEAGGGGNADGDDANDDGRVRTLGDVELATVSAANTSGAAGLAGGAAPPKGAFVIAADDDEENDVSKGNMLEESDRKRLAASIPGAVDDSKIDHPEK